MFSIRLCYCLSDYWILIQDQTFGRNRQPDNLEKVSVLRDKFEYDRERRMREKAPSRVLDEAAPRSCELDLLLDFRVICLDREASPLLDQLLYREHLWDHFLAYPLKERRREGAAPLFLQQPPCVSRECSLPWTCGSLLQERKLIPRGENP
ncbi:hypothetical protein LR48_Vigan13s000300 [Vigna angularis]|uniref:Uncharacterized protein n=1 Tax=Phaseolus angularis TaxID=3914 RepID=A0A0L9T2T8_PHAAN|nr:hypothetical protein LR48_Vigan13s000300 [Vigna angularis]